MILLLTLRAVVVQKILSKNLPCIGLCGKMGPTNLKKICTPLEIEENIFRKNSGSFDKSIKAVEKNTVTVVGVKPR